MVDLHETVLGDLCLLRLRSKLFVNIDALLGTAWVASHLLGHHHLLLSQINLLERRLLLGHHDSTYGLLGCVCVGGAWVLGHIVFLVAVCWQTRRPQTHFVVNSLL